MKCPNCGQETPGKFCHLCGTPLSVDGGSRLKGSMVAPDSAHLVRVGHEGGSAGSSGAPKPDPPRSAGWESGPELPGSKMDSGKASDVFFSSDSSSTSVRRQRMLQKQFVSGLFETTAVLFTAYAVLTLITSLVALDHSETPTHLLFFKVSLFSQMTDGSIDSLEELRTWMVVFMIPTFLIVIGMWISIGSAADPKKKMTQAGLNLVMTSAVIDFILMLITLLYVLSKGWLEDAQLDLSGYFKQFGLRGDSVEELKTATLLVLLTLIGLLIGFYCALFQIISVVKHTLTYGFADKKISFFPAVYCFILAHDLLFLLPSFSMIESASGITYLIRGLGYIFLGAAILRARSRMDEI